METKFGGKTGSPVSEVKAAGKKSKEWNLNDWKWDGDLFTAVPLNPAPSDCRSKQSFPVGPEIPATAGLLNGSSSCSDDVTLASEGGKSELDKKRRVVVIEDQELNDETRAFNLMLGGRVYPIMEEELDKCGEKGGKKAKITTNHAVCQVEDCGIDLSNGKDYHRRHKVCEMHSKASKAMVAKVMQRFCQQCSRFHALQEFDEGKRSCRRRLAGHNKRRRKTHPENASTEASLTNGRENNYLLVSLLRLLSNMQGDNNSGQTKDQDLLNQLLKSIGSFTGTVGEKNTSSTPSWYQACPNTGTSIKNTEKDQLKPDGRHLTTVPAFKMTQQNMVKDVAIDAAEKALPALHSVIPLFVKDSALAIENLPETKAKGVKLTSFDLNNVYDDTQDLTENYGRSMAPEGIENGPLDCLSSIHRDNIKSNPTQMSANYCSKTTLSQPSSNGEPQSCTDRIVFKLFGKDPGDFPLDMREQVLRWLSRSPVEIESYIRPGCIILTIYLRMEKATWDKLCSDWKSGLRELLNACKDSFWRSGWVYARVRHRFGFVCNGQVVLDTPLPTRICRTCRILSVKPIAVSGSERVQFKVEGLNLSRSTRLLCALGGNYLVLKTSYDWIEGSDSSTQNDNVQSLGFSCSIPNIIGRGFIEVEDHGLSNSFFPFIVAEQDVCSEIRTLERDLAAASNYNSLLEGTEEEGRNEAFDFINELGWLLHRTHFKFRLGRLDPTSDLFSFDRFRWLIDFSIDRGWCSVVKKLLDTFFRGFVDAGEHPSIELALMEISLLHKAVLRNSRHMVEALLRYQIDVVMDETKPERRRWRRRWQQMNKKCFFFKPDVVGPGGVTPLHVAASRDGSEDVLDALTDDPELVGIKAWRSARDGAGLTPNDYAHAQGRHEYNHLVEKKFNEKLGSGHVAVDIDGMFSDCSLKQKLANGQRSAKVASFQTERTLVRPVPHECCRICEGKLAYGGVRTSLPIYRPAMLSMVAIAAVCVCVALLFKSSPEVLYVFRPFRWELLKYGSS